MDASADGKNWRSNITMFPENRRFAFTILDDTDDSTTDNVEPVYRLLHDLGMRTTKTAWPMDCPEGSPKFWAADTLQDSRYRAFTQGLLNEGFELASHGATMESSLRERTEKGLAYLRDEMGVLPSVHANHGQNRENVYWGADRYRTWPVRLLAGSLARIRGGETYEGHRPSSPYFWGDLCLRHFRFVRNFAFDSLDLSRIAPGCPYRVRSTPYVNYWFTTADAPDVHHFNRLVTRQSIDRLVSNGGYTIVSTHLGKGFCKNGEVNTTARASLEYIGSLNGWFVPVKQLLEFLLERSGKEYISSLALLKLEARHLLDRLAGRMRS